MKTKFTAAFNYLFITGLSILLNSSLLPAQAPNALAFDGTDDLVTTAGASNLMTGSTAISISCWVYPQNPSPQTTSYDGFCGFRNNTDGDFYLLHYNATTVEARFRNSGGANFDIIGQGIVLNTWQHLAFTYDGSMLRYYHNGVELDSLMAAGFINTAGGNFYIGGLPFQAQIFNLIGKMDEVSLWSKALSPAEVSIAYGGCIDTSDTSLKLYYKFNQGIAGANNGAITTLTDESANINGTLSNFSMTGTASNFVDGIPQGASFIASICDGDTFTFHGQQLTTTGIYTDSLTSIYGCDSIITLTLNVTTIDTSVTFSTVLHANQNNATSYQWVDCNNNYAPIPAATSQNYAPVVAGSYAVIVSLNGCTDTSSCHTVTSSGIEENSIAGYIHIYPNPIADILTIEFDTQIKDADIRVDDLKGRVVWSSSHYSSNQLKLNVSHWAGGVYSLKVTSGLGSAVIRMVKK